MEITRDDWLKALADVGITKESNDDAVTVAEYMALMDLQASRMTAERHLNRLVQMGRAERVTKLSARSDGRAQYMVAYRLLKP